jgi:hypothetical protein
MSDFDHVRPDTVRRALVGPLEPNFVGEAYEFSKVLLIHILASDPFDYARVLYLAQQLDTVNDCLLTATDEGWHEAREALRRFYAKQ